MNITAKRNNPILYFKIIIKNTAHFENAAILQGGQEPMFTDTMTKIFLNTGLYTL